MPSTDSIRMKNKQVIQIAKGTIPVMLNHAVTMSMAVAIARPIPRAKRFWIAPTYSGFWLLTIQLPSMLKGARLAHQIVLIKNCSQKAITTG
jgi:hypothetical protein